jgi:hypothetical protein
MSADHGFEFEFDEELCEGNLVAVVATGSSGKVIQLYAEAELVGRTIILRQFAIYAVNMTSNELGMTALRRLARAAMEEFDVDCIRIEEARRTSGANPGRRVRRIEFRR